MGADASVLNWLTTHHADLVRDLAELVAIPSISTDGEHQKEVEQTAELTCEQMRRAGLQNVAILRTGGSNPYAYGEWLGAPGKPTVFLYAHHDVQPINYVEEWQSPAWTLTPRDGRLFGRGAADDKGAITAQLAAVAAWLKSQGKLPVNIKMVVEGEEEIGSQNLLGFFHEHQKRLQSDVIVVCDTENLDTGLPSITYALRGIVAVTVEVESARLAGPQRHGRRRTGRRRDGPQRHPVAPVLGQRPAADSALLRQGSSADTARTPSDCRSARRGSQVPRRPRHPAWRPLRDGRQDVDSTSKPGASRPSP